jgi:hypothetical protein
MKRGQNYDAAGCAARRCASCQSPFLYMKLLLFASLARTLSLPLREMSLSTPTLSLLCNATCSSYAGTSLMKETNAESRSSCSTTHFSLVNIEKGAAVIASPHLAMMTTTTTRSPERSTMNPSGRSSLVPYINFYLINTLAR